MATYTKRDDSLVSCPYDPLHQVRKCRHQIHLIKCKKDHPDADEKVCPFNAKHRVSALDFSHHMIDCPDRGLVERKIIADNEDTFRGSTQVPSYLISQPALHDEPEFWDDEAENNPRDQEAKKKPTPLFKNPEYYSGRKPAEKRQYYLSLHKRLSDDEGDESKERKPVVLKQLRTPKGEEPWKDLVPHDSNESELGRGCPNRRIAANIFGQAANETSLYTPNYLGGGLSNLNMGCGRGVFRAAANNLNYANFPPMPHGRVNNAS